MEFVTSTRATCVVLCLLLLGSAAAHGKGAQDSAEAEGSAAAQKSAAAHKTVFKNVNEDGTTVFSDVASPGSTEIEVAEPTTFSAPVYTSPTGDYDDIESENAEIGFNYQHLSIVSPQQDETIRDNAGNLVIETAIQPALRYNHSLLLQVDGTSYSDHEHGVFHLTNVDRGTHQLRLQVIDTSDRSVRFESSTITVNLKRFSILHRGGG